MVQLTSRNRVNRRQHSPQRGRKPGAGQLLQRIKPQLEFLEGRCLPSTVTNLNDSGTGSLRQAIIDTPSGGTVDFQAGLSGTITLTTGELLIDHDMTILGPGARVITVGGQASRVIEVGIGTAATISRLTLADGRGDYIQPRLMGGGSIYNAGILTINACTITANSVVSTEVGDTIQGGGIFNSGTLMINNSRITGNSASTAVSDVLEGGGIYNSGSTSIAGSTLDGNASQGIFGTGGGVFTTGSLSLTDCTINGNSADNSGGGIVALLTTVSITRCNITDNAAVYGVGGIATTGTDLVVTQSLISGNSGHIGGGLDVWGTTIITGSILNGNSAYSGGGIDVAIGPVTIVDSTLSDNSAVIGGGIYSFYFQTVNIVDSTLSHNAAKDAGGGVYNLEGAVTITDSMLNDNSAQHGGGIYNESVDGTFGTVTLTGSTLNGNTAQYAGGAVYNLNLGTGGIAAVNIATSTMSGNSSYYGGGISNYFNGTAIITASTFSGNSATFGGAIANDSIRNNYLATVTVADSTFIGNSAYYGGGIDNLYNGVLTVTNSTLGGNSATYGGGIQIDPTGMARLRDTIVGGNAGFFGPDLHGSFDSLGHNLMSNTNGANGFAPSDILNVDPRLGPLQDNGGPTPTLALLPGSPAIDAGDNTGVPQWDQRGSDFPRIVNRATDIGAYEVQSIERTINGPFDSFALPPCDHCSSPETPLGFTFDFFGRSFNSVWVNNNGTISFDGAFSDFVPGPLAQAGRAVLAPFWADVLTASPGAGEVTYGRGMLDGDPAFAATWHDVTSSNPSEFENYFQVVLIDHTDRGFQEVQFNYVTVRWDQAGSSDQAPRVGYSNGAGMSGEMPGSGTFDALLDSGSQALQVVRRYTLIVYPFTVVGGFTGDFVHFASSGSGNLPASVDLVPLGEIERRAAMTDHQGALNGSPSPSVSARFYDDVLPTHVTPQALSASDYSTVLDLVLADDRLLL